MGTGANLASVHGSKQKLRAPDRDQLCSILAAKNQTASFAKRHTDLAAASMKARKYRLLWPLGYIMQWLSC